ncbi:hypothetical protein GCM10009119_31170 [Algoriphagus jejuensis]|uniref:DUF4136 domain-containing protein n=1 Tax=Algoriphagus jejuensis TaxID=419934 RepID=A0ABN1N2N8_9BACT
MKNLILVSVAFFIFSSCKTSETVTVDAVANNEKLGQYQTFKVVEDSYSDKRNEQLTMAFREGLLRYGFEESSENPDFLIQAVVVTRDLVRNRVYNGNAFSSIPTSSIVEGTINTGMVGKVIFLIQDTKTNDISWMGVGTGITYGLKQMNAEYLDIAVYQLLATLN